MKKKDLFISSLFLFCSIGFANQPYETGTIDDTINSTNQTVTQSATALLQSKAEYASTCTAAKEPIECINTESSLQTATTACKAAAATNIAGSLTSTGSNSSTVGSLGSLAGSAIACNNVKCDVSKTEKNTCYQQCMNTCQTEKTTCDAGCTGPPPTMAACKAGCTTEYTTCTGQCASAQSEDSGYDPSIIPSEKTYNSCITSNKTQASTLQKRCRSLCKSTAMQDSSAFTQASTIVSMLTGLKDNINSSTGNTGNTPNTTTPNNQNTTNYPSNYNSTTNDNTGTGDTCAGKTGDALAKCNCTALGGTWSDKTRCTEDASTTDSYGSGSDTNSPSGTGGNNSSKFSKLTGASLSPSGSGLGVTGTSIDKNASNTTGSGSSGLKSGEVNNTGLSSDVMSGSSDGTNGLEDIIDNSYPDIVAKDEKIFDLISKIYTNKYNEKELGFFALKSDKKKKVSRTRSNRK